MRLPPWRGGPVTVVYRLCSGCRASEAAHARAAVDVLADDDATETDRQIAGDELTRAARWLRLLASATGQQETGP